MMLLRRFSVEGEGRFPVDMLREEECWPASFSDSIQLHATGPRRIQLQGYRTITTNEPNAPLWRAYGWRVI